MHVNRRMSYVVAVLIAFVGSIVETMLSYRYLSDIGVGYVNAGWFVQRVLITLLFIGGPANLLVCFMANRKNLNTFPYVMTNGFFFPMGFIGIGVGTVICLLALMFRSKRKEKDS